MNANELKLVVRNKIEAEPCLPNNLTVSDVKVVCDDDYAVVVEAKVFSATQAGRVILEGPLDALEIVDYIIRTRLSKKAKGPEQ